MLQLPLASYFPPFLPFWLTALCHLLVSTTDQAYPAEPFARLATDCIRLLFKVAHGSFLTRPQEEGLTWPTTASPKARLGMPCQEQEQEHGKSQPVKESIDNQGSQVQGGKGSWSWSFALFCIAGLRLHLAGLEAAASHWSSGVPCRVVACQEAPELQDSKQPQSHAILWMLATTQGKVYGSRKGGDRQLGKIKGR